MTELYWTARQSRSHHLYLWANNVFRGLAAAFSTFCMILLSMGGPLSTTRAEQFELRFPMKGGRLACLQFDTERVKKIRKGFLAPFVTDENLAFMMYFESIDDRKDLTAPLLKSGLLKSGITPGKQLDAICSEVKAACTPTIEQTEKLRVAAAVESREIKRLSETLTHTSIQLPLESEDELTRMLGELERFNQLSNEETRIERTLIGKVLDQTLTTDQRAQLRWRYMKPYVALLKQVRIYTNDQQETDLRDMVLSDDTPPLTLRKNRPQQHQYFLKLMKKQTPSPFTKRGWLQLNELGKNDWRFR